MEEEREIPTMKKKNSSLLIIIILLFCVITLASLLILKVRQGNTDSTNNTTQLPAPSTETQGNSANSAQSGNSKASENQDELPLIISGGNKTSTPEQDQSTVVTGELSSTDDFTSSDAKNPSGEVDYLYQEIAPATYDSFYGIWGGATKDRAKAERFLATSIDSGFPDAELFITSDWSNLNSDPYFVVSYGIFRSEEEAKEVLPSVQKVYYDAYVKYSGSYIGD